MCKPHFFVFGLVCFYLVCGFLDFFSMSLVSGLVRIWPSEFFKGLGIQQLCSVEVLRLGVLKFGLLGSRGCLSHSGVEERNQYVMQMRL